MNVLFWTKQISFSLIPSVRGSAEPYPVKKRNSSTASKEILNRLAILFFSIWGVTKRWGSPKLLIGESYGTTRAGGLAGYLQGRHGAYLNAIMLVSVVLNFQTIRFAPGNDLPYILYLPTYAATARYHDKLSEIDDTEFETFMDEVRAFATGDYTVALMQGSAVPPEQRANIVQQLAKYTGLTPEYIERTDIRINIMRFCKEFAPG